jgi:L-histidine Nalpha-methyltransferase
MRHFAASENVPVDVKDFASDVEYYLTLEPRQLPSRYLYDALGSALFDAICELPWYRITRAELGLLDKHGREILARAMSLPGLPRLSRIVELGPGSGAKLLTLIQAADGPADDPDGSAKAGHYVRDVRDIRAARLELHLIDVSGNALDQAGQALAALDDVEIVKHQTTYENGLREVARTGVRTLVLFLGSNIGNFDRPGADAFLRSIRATLGPGDDLLVGADLVKPECELLLAYDDPLGVTAAFDRNLLVRINRDLGGDFDLDAFGHRAVWNRDESRVEMHLVSRRRQRVRIPAAHIDLTFKDGETIWTESSYKYEPDELAALLERAGFRPVARWLAAEERFLLTLVRAE